jgi:hypothetical protein
VINAALIILAFVLGTVFGIGITTYCVSFAIKAKGEIKAGTARIFKEPDSVDAELEMLDEREKK